MSAEPILVLCRMTVLLILFHGFYLLFLRKLTFYKEIRFYFLTGLVLSLVLPFVSFEISVSGSGPVLQELSNTIPALSTPVNPY